MNNLSDEKAGSNFLTFFSGVLLGSVIGTITGLLLAPKAGTETRHQLSENMFDTQSKAKHLLDGAKANIGQSVDLASKNIESTVTRVVDAFNAGSKAAQDSIKDQNIAKINKSDKMIDVVKSENIISVDNSDKVKKEKDFSESKEGKNEQVDGQSI